MKDTKAVVVMIVQIRQREHGIVIELSGRFDFYARKAFQSALGEAKNGLPHFIVVDLSNVPFIDSAALGSCRSGTRDYRREKGMPIRLAGAHGYVQKVLEWFRIAQLIPTFSTVEEAARPSIVHQPSRPASV